MKINALLGTLALVVATALPTLGEAQVGHHRGRTVVIHPNGSKTVYFHRRPRRRVIVVRHRPVHHHPRRTVIIHR